MFNPYLRWIRCGRVQFDFVRDLASEFPSAISEFTVDVSRDKFDCDIVVGSGYNLKPEAQWLVSGKQAKTDATDDIGVLGTWTNEVVE